MRATTRAWAERLLALEEASRSAADAQVHVQVVDRLRDSHAPVFGPEAFVVLLKRALVLARSDVPTLRNVTITADGRMTGLVPGDDVEATVAITAHFLDLLVTFVGEALTLRLLREAWPGALLNIEEPR